MAPWVKDPVLLLLIAWVTAVAQVQSLAQKFPFAMGSAKKKKKKRRRRRKEKKKQVMQWI